ncbi:chloride channel protein [Sphingobium sp. H39-3-25]|uniref:chloride channel protein n=1 Tax=Sphingobium arseniciresistens TaxID=3030834 RepID=UPI0023B89ADB|nr:chloride channel protein [Sphingobium arseniciresistens]
MVSDFFDRVPRAIRGRLAAVTGAILLSLFAIAFADCGEVAQSAFARLAKAHPLMPFVISPSLFMLVVYLTRRWAPAARGSGIPQVIAAGHDPEQGAKGPLISLRSAAAKFVGTVMMLFAGGSVGREGPTVQISAAVMVAVHRWLRVPVSAGVIIAGGAAGVAAAFNTPLAGVAFAIEELASAFEQKVAVFVMAAVMISGLVSLGLSGDYVYFGVMSQKMPVKDMLLVAPLAGVTGGIIGGLFSRSLIAMARSRFPLLVRARARPLLAAGACGLVVAIVGVTTAGLTWGTGYETTRDLLAGEHAPLMFGPAKFIAALATALSGAPGGIFAPSLSVGAGFGNLLSKLMPFSPSGAVVLLGMAGYFTGVVRAPLTASIIMMEMTAERSMILPLFGTALIADWISALVCQPKLYHALSKQFLPE